MGYPKKGIACSLSLFGYEQYASNNLDQYNLTHGVYKVPKWKYYVPSRCFYLEKGIARSLNILFSEFEDNMH
jgi:hypothetical protein